MYDKHDIKTRMLTPVGVEITEQALYAHYAVWRNVRVVIESNSDLDNVRQQLVCAFPGDWDRLAINRGWRL